MAKQLEEKIEETAAAAQIASANFEAIPEVEPIPEAEPAPMAEPEIVPVDQPEPIQVAGIKDIIKPVGEAVIKRVEEAEKRVLPRMGAEPVEEVGGRLLIREADPSEVQAFSEAIGGEYTKGLNFPRIAEQMGDVNAADYLARLKDANKELFEKARRGTIDLAAIQKMAEDEGLEDTVAYFLTREPGSTETAEKIFAGVLASFAMIKETDAAFVAARRMPAGEARDKAMANANQMMVAQAVLLSNVSGSISEAGRTLFVSRKAGEMGVDLRQRSAQIVGLFGTENVDDIEYMGDLYMSLPTSRAKNNFVKQGIGKSMDVITEVWINSILSMPTTHLVNIAGNGLMMATRVVEGAVASGIGRARTAITGSTERVRMREAIAQLDGMRRGLGDALWVAGKTLVTEEPGDVVTKIDVRNRRAIGTSGDPRVIIDQLRQGNMAAASVNMMGVYARMGGRFLLAEDDFFKGVAYRMSVYENASIRAGNLYDQMIAAGKTKEEAKLAAAAEEARIINNPPEDIEMDARQAAVQMTFQGDLPGFLGDMQGAMSHPVAKLFVPFYKTPTNVMKEVVNRTPLMLAYPGFYKKLKAGGREADIALSKLAVGSTVGSMFAYAAMGLDRPDNDMIIVGGGPTDYEAKQAYLRMGLNPYTINFKNYDQRGNWDGTYTSYSYSRFDPVSGVLAMAADFAYYAQYEDDQTTLDGLALALGLSVAKYAGELPFLQGVQDMASIFRNPDPDAIMVAFGEMLAQKGTEAVLSLAPTVSSFSAGIERMGEPGEGAAGPVAPSSMLPETGLFGEDPTELPAFARGFYQALERAKGRNPFFSDQVEPRLNLWGERMMQGTGAGWEFISPVRIQQTKYNAVDMELMELGGGFRMPSKKIEGVLLNAVQYNKWLTYMNQIDGKGRMPDDPRYDAGSTMLNALNKVIVSKEYKGIELDEDKLEILAGIVSSYQKAGKQVLIKEDAYLQGKIAAVK